MPRPRHLLAALCLSAALIPAARADIVHQHLPTDNYAEARIALNDAIIDEGLRVAAVSDFGAMLARTEADVHHGAAVYRHAEVFAFCSVQVAARLVREAAENIALCPLTIGLYQLDAGGDARIQLVYRPPGGSSPGAEAGRALLARIGGRVRESFPARR